MKTTIHARALVVFLAIVLLPLGALTFFTPSYQTNDDIAMRLLAEGNFVPGDEPLPYLMFINVILGKILSLAYRVTTAVPWYDLVLGGSAIAASAALVYIWTGTARKVELIWAVLFAAYFLFPIFVSVQFSLSGMACAAAGIGLIARAAVTDLEARSQRLHLLFGMALFFWGSLIRFEGAVLIAIEGFALALPFVFGTVRTAEARPRLRRAVLVAGAALLLTGLGFAVNQLAYRQAKGWKNFYEYNMLRSRLGEYITPERLTAEAADKLVKEVGWSSNDFLLFRNWFFTDPELFSLVKVRQAERLIYGTASKPADDSRAIRLQRGRDLGKAFFSETRWAFLLMGVFVLARGMRPKLVLYFAGIALTLGLLIVGISLAMKAPPQRIFWPMLIMAATMLAIASQRWGRPTHWSVNAAAILLAAYVVAMAIPPLRKESEARRLAAEVAQSEVESLRRTGATMFVLHANSFPYEDFWTPLHTEKTPFDFVGLGASARTPPVQDFLSGTGRTDLPWSLCTDPAMVIITEPYITSWLTTFVQEHRGVAVQFDQTFKGKRITAWKCHRM
jgi:hypothetical protein